MGILVRIDKSLTNYDYGNFSENLVKITMEILVRNVDLLQVDLLAGGASLVWPQSGRPRATKSREVPISVRSINI